MIMKKLCISIGLISAIASTLLSITNNFNSAIIPILIAFSSGLFVLLFSKKNQQKPKTLQFMFLLVIFSLSLTVYKNVDDGYKTDNIGQTNQNSEKNTDGLREILIGI